MSRPSVPATAAPGRIVESTTPSPVAAAARSAPQLISTSRVSGSWEVSSSMVETGCPGTSGQVTTGVLIRTGANGSSTAAMIASAPTSGPHQGAVRPRAGDWSGAGAPGDEGRAGTASWAVPVRAVTPPATGPSW